MSAIGLWLQDQLRKIVDPDHDTGPSLSREVELRPPDTIDQEPTMRGFSIDPDEIAQYTLSCPRCGYAVQVEAQPYTLFDSIRLEHTDFLHRVVIAGKRSEKQA